ncbi:zinc finger, CCHC-type containing protein [Tanacetum coccineum]
MDVMTTFLNDELDKEVYMNQPQGFIMPEKENKIFGTDEVQVNLTKEFLSSKFSMKDMGDADVILGIRIKHESNEISISQSYYIEKPMYNGKSRHLGVRHSMIRELITNGVVSIEFVRSQQNLADHLTKGLARDLVIKSAEGMGLNGLKHMYLHIIPRMCLEPAEKEDEVVNFLMVNFFEKVLSRSMNKEEPPMYSNGLKGSILRTP